MLRSNRKPKYKIVVFDWHGVLDKGHFAFVFKDFWRLSSRNYGGWKRYKLIKLAYKYNALYKKYNKNIISVDEFWAEVNMDFDSKIVDLFRSIVDDFQPLKCGLDLFEEFKSSYQCYLMSDCPVDKKELILEKISSLGLEFEKCFFSCDYGLMKNQRKFFKVFEEETGFKAGEILFWDDNFLNVWKSRTVGWKGKVFRKR